MDSAAKYESSSGSGSLSVSESAFKIEEPGLTYSKTDPDTDSDHDPESHCGAPRFAGQAKATASSRGRLQTGRCPAPGEIELTQSESPVTPAIRFLRERRIQFKEHLYRYQEHGGTSVGATELGYPEHVLIKTLVMQTDAKKVILVLMHGDCEVSTKKLARLLGVKSVEPCDDRTAGRHTGYVFGGTSPFGTRASLPVYAEKTIFDLPSILINGGKRGFLVEINPHVLREILPIEEVEVAIPK